MNLNSKSNLELLSTLKLQVESERKLLMEILYSLQEVENRCLHLGMGYPDLYSFAMKELGYSSGAAYRRISAMRLLKSVPEVAPQLASGELGLENASKAQSFFRKEDQRRKNKGELKLTLEDKREVVSELLGKSTREGLRVLMERAPDVVIPSEKIRPLPEQKTMIQFVASAELMSKLEKLKHLMANQNFEGQIGVLIEKLADIALKKLKPAPVEPDKSKTTSSPSIQTQARVYQSASTASASATFELKTSSATLIQASPPPGKAIQPPQKTRSRYIPAKIKRQVILRDQSGCTYQDPKTGRFCGTRHGLQFDHIFPFSWGGEHSLNNLALRCGAHNRFRAEQMRLI